MASVYTSGQSELSYHATRNYMEDRQFRTFSVNGYLAGGPNTTDAGISLHVLVPNALTNLNAHRLKLALPHDLASIRPEGIKYFIPSDKAGSFQGRWQHVAKM